jgi:methylated-DNA-[protein]-cysteine S-methyltransferase
MPVPGPDCGSQHYCLFTTALGTCGVAWSERGLTRLLLPEADAGRTEMRLRSCATGPADPSPAVRDVIADIQRFMRGERIDFAAVAIDLGAASAFDLAVWTAARMIGWSETTTYGELARRCGAPAAAREVGRALGRNPLPIIVPCHRILAAGRKIGGFSAPGGTDTKERLLALEGVYLNETPLIPGLLPTAMRSRSA